MKDQLTARHVELLLFTNHRVMGESLHNSPFEDELRVIHVVALAHSSDNIRSVGELN